MAIAASVIPENIQAMTDQTTQLKALLSWFKQEFFRWTDVPDCSTCGNSGKNLQALQAGEPTPEEREGMAGRVEIYLCTKCQ